MSRSASDAHDELMSLLPPGWIWPRAGDGSVLGAVLWGPAVLFAEVEAVAAQMMDEIDPRTAVACIDDFERVLGPDPCGRDTSGMSLAARQDLAHQRWTARGGQSVAYYIALAAKRGVDITIEECIPSYADELRAGDELVEPPEQFVWVVNLSLGAWTEFYAGESEAGERLYDYDLSDIECDIRRVKPAHTEVVFVYLDHGLPPLLSVEEWPVINVTAEPRAAVDIKIERA